MSIEALFAAIGLAVIAIAIWYGSIVRPPWAEPDYLIIRFGSFPFVAQRSRVAPNVSAAKSVRRRLAVTQVCYWIALGLSGSLSLGHSIWLHAIAFAGIIVLFNLVALGLVAGLPVYRQSAESAAAMAPAIGRISVREHEH